VLVFEIQMIVIWLCLQDYFQGFPREDYDSAAVMPVDEVAVVTQGDARAVHKLEVLSHPDEPLVLYAFLV